MKNRKWKKRISILLALLCALSLFTGCARKTEAQGPDLYAVARGVGTKKVTLKISGSFPEGAEAGLVIPEVAIPVETTEYELSEEQIAELELTEEEAEKITEASSAESLVPLVQAELKNQKENLLTYTITGEKEGTGELSVVFLRDGVRQASVTIRMEVDDSGKITSAVLSIDENPEYRTVSFGEEIALVTGITGESTRDFTLDGSYEKWEAYEETPEIVKLSGMDTDAGTNRTTWKIEAVSAGEGTVSFRNKETDELYRVSLSVTESAGEEGEKVLSLSFGETEVTVYEEILEEADIEEGNLDDEGEAIIENLFLPEDAKVSDIIGLAAEDGAGGNTPTTVDMELTFRDTSLFYTATKSVTMEEYLADFENDDTAGVTGRETFSAGGRTVTYLEMECGLALWEENGALYILTIIDGERSGDKALIQAFLESESR